MGGTSKSVHGFIRDSEGIPMRFCVLPLSDPVVTFVVFKLLFFVEFRVEPLKVVLRDGTESF